ncbi:MAG: M56 family metallopeptidase [Bacteroidales bacterium]|jgi:TonB family protein
MNAFLIYLIKSAFCLAAFYLVYFFLLSRDTQYMRNRLFIIASVLAALVIPVITIRTGKPVNLPVFGKTLSEVLISGNSADVKASPSKATPGITEIFLIIYIAGLILSASKLLFDIARLSFLIIRKKEKDSNIIRPHALKTAGFSALGHLFIGTGLSPEESDEIIRHEKYHLENHHFLDILFIEIVSVIQWFNPFIHLFNRSLRAVHEYQADEGCLTMGIPLVSYQNLIMNQLFLSKAFTMTNSFSNPSLIKKRMVMMTKKRSGMLANLKLLMVLPAIAIVMFAFSSCRGKAKPGQQATAIAPPSLPPPPPPPPPMPKFEVKDGDTTWFQVDQMPQYPGGDTALLYFINRHIKYPEDAKSKGIQGRVILKFIIEPDCRVDKAVILHGVNPELDAEALRVVNSFPKFEKPGIQKGKSVPVAFMVPIIFSLK